MDTSHLSVDPEPLAHLLIPEGRTLPLIKRLVVLLPDQDANEVELAQRIWGMASARRLGVLYLGLCESPATEARLLRRLATVAAVTRDDWVTVQTRHVLGGDWVKVVRSAWRPGDLVVCHAEQMARPYGIWRKPLGAALVAALEAPVMQLSGFYPELPEAHASLRARIASWSIPVGIILGFFLIQIRIDQSLTGWARTTLLSLSAVTEIGLVGLWNLMAV